MVSLGKGDFAENRKNFQNKLMIEKIEEDEQKSVKNKVNSSVMEVSLQRDKVVKMWNEKPHRWIEKKTKAKIGERGEAGANAAFWTRNIKEEGNNNGDEVKRKMKTAQNNRATRVWSMECCARASELLDMDVDYYIYPLRALTRMCPGTCIEFHGKWYGNECWMAVAQ